MDSHLSFTRIFRWGPSHGLGCVLLISVLLLFMAAPMTQTASPDQGNAMTLNPLPDAVNGQLLRPRPGEVRIALCKNGSGFGNYKLKSISLTCTDVSPGSYKVEITTSRLTAGGEGFRAKSSELVPPKFNTKTECA